MNNRYLSKAWKWLWNLLWNTFLSLLGRAIGIVIFLLRIIVPVLIRMFVQGMWMGLITLAAITQGLPEHCRRLADMWTEMAIKEYKLTTNYKNMVSSFLETVAWLVTFAGILIIVEVIHFLFHLII